MRALIIIIVMLFLNIIDANAQNTIFVPFLKDPNKPRLVISEEYSPTICFTGQKIRIRVDLINAPSNITQWKTIPNKFEAKIIEATSRYVILEVSGDVPEVWGVYVDARYQYKGKSYAVFYTFDIYFIKPP